MKKLFFVFAAICFVAAPALAVVSSDVSVVVQDEKVKITENELPEAVKSTLKGEDYKTWSVNAVYHLKNADQYEVELKNEAETKTVKFDKEGKVVS